MPFRQRRGGRTSALRRASRPGELIRDLKVVAAREGTSCSALVEQYAKEIIKQKAGPGSHP